MRTVNITSAAGPQKLSSSSASRIAHGAIDSSVEFVGAHGIEVQRIASEYASGTEENDTFRGVEHHVVSLREISDQEVVSKICFACPASLSIQGNSLAMQALTYASLPLDDHIDRTILAAPSHSAKIMILPLVGPRVSFQGVSRSGHAGTSNFMSSSIRCVALARSVMAILRTCGLRAIDVQSTSASVRMYRKALTIRPLFPDRPFLLMEIHAPECLPSM